MKIKSGMRKAFYLADGVSNGEGIYTFTSIQSLESDAPAVFSFTDHGHHFTGDYKGIAVIKVDSEGNLQKLAATGFSSMNRDNHVILRAGSPCDIFVTPGKNGWHAVVADKEHHVQIFAEE